jgi:hypothetical protein
MAATVGRPSFVLLAGGKARLPWNVRMVGRILGGPEHLGLLNIPVNNWLPCIEILQQLAAYVYLSVQQADSTVGDLGPVCLIPHL